MLNIMIENENKRFANHSIRFLILSIMKLISQINILLFPKLKVSYNPLLSKSTLKYLVYCQVF